MRCYRIIQGILYVNHTINNAVQDSAKLERKPLEDRITNEESWNVMETSWKKIRFPLPSHKLRARIPHNKLCFAPRNIRPCGAVSEYHRTRYYLKQKKRRTGMDWEIIHRISNIATHPKAFGGSYVYNWSGIDNIPVVDSQVSDHANRIWTILFFSRSEYLLSLIFTYLN